LRKFALIAASTTLAFGAAAPAALAGPEKFTFTVKANSAKAGTKARPRANTLTTGLTLEGPAPTSETQYAMTRAVIYLDKAFKVSDRKFKKTCDKGTVLTDPDACSKASRVGVGTGEGIVYPLPDTPSPLELRAFQGPKNELLIRVHTDTPSTVTGIFRGKIKKATGTYGTKIELRVPDADDDAQGYGNLLNPVGDIIPTLSEFLLKLGGTQKKTPYLATTGCTKGTWNFRADLTFSDGTSATDATAVKCKK